MNQSTAMGYSAPKDQAPHNPSIDERMQSAVERLHSQADRLRSLADRLCGVEIEREKQGAQVANVEPIRTRPVFAAIDNSIDAVHYLADRIAVDCERIAGRANIPG
jgi:hypothetical protein